MKNLVKSENAYYKAGMEMVQVAILIAIAITAGLIFREKIGEFITTVFDGLNSNDLESFTFK